MNDNENLKSLYNTLQKEGYTPPVFEQFAKDMEDDSNLRGVYSTLQNEGYTPPDYDTFRSDMGFGKVAKTNPKVKVGSHAQMVVDEYDRAAKAVGTELTSNNEKSDSEAINEANEPNRTDNPNKTNEPDRPNTPRMQFVPETENVIMATPTAETLKKHPWLKADEAVPFDRNTGEPLYTWVDEQDNPILQRDLDVRRAKEEITGEKEYMQKTPASLQLPGGTTRGVRLDGSISGYVDNMMKQQYGDDYLNGQYTTKDGRLVSGAEYLNEKAQETYDQLNKEMDEARMSYIDADEEKRKELVDALANKYDGLLTRDTIQRAMDDEQAQEEAKGTRRERERTQLDTAYDTAYARRAEAMNENMRKAQEEYENSSWLDRMFGGNPVQRAYWANQNDRRIQIADTQMNIVLDARKIIDAGEAYDKGETWAGRLVRGMGDALTDTGLYDSGVEDMHDLRNVKNALDAYEAGTATKEQKELLDVYALLHTAQGENADAMGGWYGAGGTTVQALPFMAQMAINPASNLGSATMKAATKWGVKQFGKTAMNKYLKRMFVTSLKAGGRVTGDALAAVLPAFTFGSPAITADTYDRLIGNVHGTEDEAGNIIYKNRSDFETSKGAAIAKAAGANLLEYQSEMAGPYFGALSKIAKTGTLKGLEKIGLEKTRDLLTRFSNKDFYRAYASFARKTQWHGTFEEYLEEVYNNVANAIFIGDMDFSTGDNGVFNLEMNLDTLLGVAVMSGAMSTLKTVDYARTRGRIKDELDEAYKSGLDIFGTDEWERITDRIDGLDDDKAASEIRKIISGVDGKERKHAVVNYAAASFMNQGLNMGELKNSLEQISDAAVNGSVPKDAIPGIENLTPEKQQNVHEDGMIHTALLYPTADNGGEPQEVFITKGNVVIRGDGTIDTEASSNAIYYKGSDGQVHMTSPDKIQSVNEPISIEEYAAAGEKNEPNMPNKVNTTEGFAVGDEVNVNIDDEQAAGEITGITEDGLLIVSYETPDGTISSIRISPDELRNMNKPNDEQPPMGGAGAVVEEPAVDIGNNEPQNIPENSNIELQNIPIEEDGTQNIESAGNDAEEIIPTDEDGNPRYYDAPVEATIADLYDGSLDDTEVQGFIDANINEAQKKYENVEKKAPKIGTNKAKYLEQKRKWQADVDEAKRVLDYWNEVNAQKESITHTTPQEIEAAQAELSGQNAREEYAAMNENVPTNAVAVASDFIRGAKITPESFRAETGYGAGEQRRFVGMIATEQNGGKSIDRLAEELVSYDNAELNGVTFNGDTGAAKDAILEALQGAGTRGELAVDNTSEQERYVEARRAELDAQYMEAYGMTYEDYLAYEEQKLPEMLRKYANFDEVEYYNLYADEIERTLNASINEQGNDTAGEEPRIGGGNEVLPGERTDNARGSADGTEQGTEVPTGVQGTVEDGVVPKETQQLAPEPIGTNRFGNIYNWVKGQFQSAASFLNNLKSGYLRGVFYRDGIGNIDMVWGNEKAGLQHIINKHIEEADDFNSVEEAMQVINDTINNGTISQQGTNISLDYNGYRVSIAQSKEGNWVLTAFDKTRSRAEKQRNKGNATRGDQSVSDMENGTLVSPQLASSESKDTQTSTNEQTIGEKIAQAEAETDTEPTEAQKEAGNYKKGHVKIDGFDVTIENPKGSVRSGKDADGTPWSVTMNNTYGYIRGTEGVDGDHIDVFLSDDPTQGNVYVIDQVNEDGSFDEHKAMYGFKSALAAKRAYLANYSPGWKGLGTITKVSKEEFKKWINSSHRKTKPFAEYKSVNKDGAQNEGYSTDGGVRFREMEDDGNKSLVGVHNITEDKLVKAIRQGGLANPSVAVIDADRQTHEGYGEISLIMPSNKINRRTGHNAGTFTNDAWTPMYPPIERQFGKGGSERAAQDIASVAEEMRSEVRQGINSWMDGRNGIGLEYLFLHERNEAPLTVRVEPVYPERLRNEVAEIMNGKDSFMDLDEAEKQSIVNLLVRERYDGDSAKYTDEIKQRIKHDEERIAKRPNSLFSRRVKMDVDFMKEYGYDYSEAKSFVDAIVEDGRTAGTTDTRATLTAAQSAIAERGLQEEYDKWLDGLNDRYNINEVIFDGFTPSGNRRYVPNTLENVSRLMKKNGRNGATGLGTSFSNFAASVLKAKGTLNDIRKMKGNLTSEHKNVDEFREKWGNVFYELGNKLQPDATGFEDYGLARLAEAATQKKPRKYIKDEYGIEMSDDDVKKLDDMIRAIRENYPAMYFETKFERPVYFNEFTAAVVPNNIKPSTRKTLEDAGLKLFEYDPNMEGDRQRIFNEATREEGVRFRSDENLFNYDGLLTRNGIDTAVADIANKLNIGVMVAHSIDEVSDEGVRRAIEKGRNVKGWYDTRTGEIVVYAPNATDADDAVRTVLHEGVAHYGLRQLVGDENFDTFLDNIYNNVDEGIKAAIDEKAQRHGWSTRVATEEYLASLAEDTNFEAARSSGLWQRIKDFFMDLLTKAGIRLNEALTDNELRYILWRSYENLAEPNGRDIIGTVRDVAMQGRLGVGNYGNEDVRLRETEEEQAPEKKSENKYRELYDRRVSKKTARLNRSYFDSMQPVKVLQQTITEETGQQIRPEENVYLQENRANSMSQRKHEMWERGHMEPARREVTKLMQQIMGGNWLTGRFKLPKTRRNAYNAVVRYMKSKHGLENNEYRRNMEAEAAREPFEAEIGAVEKLVKDGNISRAEADKRQAELKEQADKAETESRAKTLNKDYSGLQGIYGKDFERKAKEYVEDFEGAYDTAPLWREWNGATKAILEEEYKSGLLSKELYDRIRNMYKYYIPLKGWAENRAEDVYTYYATGSGDGGKPHRREGRTSESDDPLVTLEQDADRQFTAAARNRTKQALYNLATAHKSSLLTVRRQWYQNMGTKENPDWQRKDPEIPENATPEQMEQIIKDFEKDMRKLEKEGTAMRQKKPMILPYHATKSMEKEHTVRVMVNGKEYVIYVNGNPAAAQAVNGTSTPQDPDGSVLKRIYGALRWINRVKASLLTAVNVNFIPGNLVRDAQYSIQNMKAKEPVGYVLKYVKNLGEGMAKMTSARLFYKDKKGTLNMDDKTERLFKEFLDNGGETGYTARYTLEKQRRRNMAAINRMTGIDWLAGLRMLQHSLEYVNRSVETIVRFAAYKTSREAGRSLAQSINDATEESVDVDKHGSGELGNKEWRLAYIFSNVGFQALRRLMENASGHPVRFTLAQIERFALGFAVPMMAKAMLDAYGDDDEKDAYEALPEWMRESGLAVPVSPILRKVGADDAADKVKRVFLYLPLGPEDKIWYALGENTWHLFNKDNITEEEAMDMAVKFGSLAADLLPLDFQGYGGNPIVSLAPTPVQDFVALKENVNYWGQPIYRESTNYNEHDPGHRLAFTGTPEWYVERAEDINRLTGGDEYTKGWLSPKPEQIEYFINQTGGGVTRVVNQVMSLIERAGEDGNKDIQVLKNVPVVSSLAKKADVQDGKDGFDREKYYDYIDEYEKALHDYNAYRKAKRNGDDEAGQKAEKLKESPTGERMDIIRKDIRKIRNKDKQVRRIDEKENPTAEEEARRDKLKTESNELKQKLLEKLDKVKEKPGKQ